MCDLAVIGGGPGGLVVAGVAARQGVKVTLIERVDRPGGDCLHTGCMPRKVDYRVVPRVTSTDPEIAAAGPDGTSAREQGIHHEVARFPLADINRAVTDTAGEGVLKVILVRDRVAGATLVWLVNYLPP